MPVRRYVKQLLPDSLVKTIRFLLGPIKRCGRWARAATILLSPVPDRQDIKVSYGHSVTPKARATVSGGLVKFASLHEVYPNSPRCFNILYLGSSSLPQDPDLLVRLAKRRGAKVVWNQNGVGFPAWAGNGWEDVNRPMKSILPQADHVFYQSQFCKRSADIHLGPPQGSWEILYNPVDTDAFRPAQGPVPPRPLTLLHAGSVMALYRLEVALRTLAELTRLGADVEMLFAGRFAWSTDPAEMEREASGLINELALRDRVRLLPAYSRNEAPAFFQRGDMLLHTKVNDPCPTVVLEAMACGLPIVYSHSGGVPELVGPHAGIGVPDHADWTRMEPADPTDLAQAVLQVAAHRESYSAAARERAVNLFDVRLWRKRHQEVFKALLG